MFTTLNQTLIKFIPALYLFWSITDTVCVCVYLYACMCVCVCIYMCVCVCMYGRVMILQHYPLQLTPCFLSSYSRVFPSSLASTAFELAAFSTTVQKIMADERLCLPSWAGRMRETYACSMLTKNRPKGNLLVLTLLEVPLKA